MAYSAEIWLNLSCWKATDWAENCLHGVNGLDSALVADIWLKSSLLIYADFI